MMSVEQSPPATGGMPPLRLIDHLPEVRGRYNENVPLGRSTWFKVGGEAEVVFRPADADDLSFFLANKPARVAVTVIGVGSNLLVRDGGVRGVVIRLGRQFAAVAIDGEELTAGAGGLDMNVALSAEQAGLSGFEFLSGIPGSIGGALRMNAGAYGSEMKDIVISARMLDDTGVFHQMTLDELGFRYRHCSLPENWIFVSAVMKGRREAKDVISRRMQEIAAARKDSQPVRSSTGGSTFANPTDPKAAGVAAWRLIDRSGCRGLRRGGAMVSEKHCNFLINTGDATAADLEGLGEEVRRRVLRVTGITLQWEIRRLGVALARTERRDRS